MIILYAVREVTVDDVIVFALIRRRTKRDHKINRQTSVNAIVEVACHHHRSKFSNILYLPDFEFHLVEIFLRTVVLC